MIVRAVDLQPEGLQVELPLELRPFSYEGGLEIGVAAATLKAQVLPSRGGLKCSGRLEATAFVPCSRCLEPYLFPVGWDFDVTYLPVPGGQGAEGSELQISKEELDVAYLSEEGGLDMNALAAEQIYLALPMKPLCADDCKGLCQCCGSNLNIEGCRHQATA